jgi:hypothetical protein
MSALTQKAIDQLDGLIGRAQLGSGKAAELHVIHLLWIQLLSSLPLDPPTVERAPYEQKVEVSMS